VVEYPGVAWILSKIEALDENLQAKKFWFLGGSV
jgi:hypothetical protein